MEKNNETVVLELKAEKKNIFADLNGSTCNVSFGNRKSTDVL